MKQTAVEWFEDQVGRSCLMAFKEFNEIFEKAKAMEKKAHQETWDVAHQAGRFEGKGIAEEDWQTFETYWEETFKQREK
jgi:hypothetical protein